MSVITSQLSLAQHFLEQEDVVAIPTETVYGLAANIYSEKAVNKIYKIKNRPKNNPLIVHISSIDKLDDIAINIPKKAIELAKIFWPGPLTLLLEKHPTLPSWVTSNKATVAVRVPNHNQTLQLLKALKFPLAAPSANPFSKISPTTALHVKEYFDTEVPVILDGGRCEKGVESTIIGFENGEPVLYRFGAISIEEIESVIGKVITTINRETEQPIAPGMYYKHYAPRISLVIAEDINKMLINYSGKKIGLLYYGSIEYNSTSIKCKEQLTQTNNWAEAASNLYEALHRLDDKDLDIIIAPKFPDEGLGKTLNDRLKRASVK